MSTSAQYFLPAPTGYAAGSARARSFGVRRYLDPKTRDYVADGGALKQDDGFTSKVVLALSTKLGSAEAVRTCGSRLHEIKRADEQGRKLAENHALRALAHLTTDIRDLRVAASISPKNPSRIDLVITGKKGLQALRVDYTAVLGGGSP